MSSSATSLPLIQWRLAVRVGHLLADVGDLGAYLAHHLIDPTPNREIRRAPRRQTAQCRQYRSGDAIKQSLTSSRLTKMRFFSAIWMRSSSALALVCSARRLPCGVIAAARAASIADRRRGLVEREAIALLLDHAFGFKLADVRAAAIEVQCLDTLTIAVPLATGEQLMVAIIVSRVGAAMEQSFTQMEP